jgi:pimeloyl-ACP methyl ester carboxylesterase
MISMRISCRYMPRSGRTRHSRRRIVIGESMGGAIVQRMAIKHPDRVRSATLFYTAPGFDMAFIGDAIIAGRFAAPPLTSRHASREDAIATMVANEQLSASSEFPFDEAWIVAVEGTASYDRGLHPDGAAAPGARTMVTARAPGSTLWHRIAVRQP